MSKLIYVSGLPKVSSVNFKPSKSRNVMVKYGNDCVYVSSPLSVGNKKLGNNIAIFNLLAVHSCLNCKECARACYALKSQRQYKTVFDKRAIYTHLARTQINVLFNLIDANLTKLGNKISYVRIHESGDFFSQEYVDMWERIVKKHTTLRFYTYTKTDKIFDFSGLKSLPNFNLVNSILPDGSINFGTKEYCEEKAEKFGCSICPNTKTNQVHCGTECSLCMSNNNVVFLQH